MSRGMLMTVLARYAGESTEGGTVWYEKGMNWAKNKGISDGSAPNRNITREQLAAMLYRYAGEPDGAAGPVRLHGRRLGFCVCGKGGAVVRQERYPDR